MPGYELINKEEYLECRDVLKKVKLFLGWDSIPLEKEFLK